MQLSRRLPRWQLPFVLITLGLCAWPTSVGGAVRTFGVPMTETSAFADLPAGQRYLFTLVDVLLTAAIIAGGSAFVHSIMSTATTSFESTKAKAKGEA